MIIVILLSLVLKNKNYQTLNNPNNQDAPLVSSQVSIESQDSSESKDNNYYSVNLSNLTEDQYNQITKNWKKVTLEDGSSIMYPPDWKFISPMGNAKLLPPWVNVENYQSDYIELGTSPSVSNNPNMRCIGDTEIVSCVIGSNQKTNKVFDLMFYYH